MYSKFFTNAALEKMMFAAQKATRNHNSSDYTTEELLALRLATTCIIETMKAAGHELPMLEELELRSIHFHTDRPTREHNQACGLLTLFAKDCYEELIGREEIQGRIS